MGGALIGVISALFVIQSQQAVISTVFLLVVYAVSIIVIWNRTSVPKINSFQRDLESIDNELYNIITKEDDAENLIKRLYNRK